jgi:formate dehydrogenase subunit gamma
MSSQNQADLLPALHRLQERFGYISDLAIADLAKTHNLAQAEVVGVIGFYHDFRRTPPGKQRLRICRAESCQSMGADALAMYASTLLGVEFGATTSNGEVTLEAAYCLGNCACSPAVMLDDELHGRVSNERLDAILAEGRSA